MVPPFPRHNLIRILIPIRISPLFRKASFFLFLIILTVSSSFAKNSVPGKTMKVHPLPQKRNITIQSQSLITGGSHKKLRRLPHIFSRVLELPFRSDAEVTVQDGPDCFRFVAETDPINDVRVHRVEIHPGIIKIVIRPGNVVDFTSINDLELDMWRFRLPESTRPDLATAVYQDGELIVTVPKGAVYEQVRGMGNGNNNNRLLLVQ